MGGCFGKPGKKVNPQCSNSQFINGGTHEKSYNNSETNVPGLETTKHTLDQSEVHAKNPDKISKEKTIKIRSEISKNASTNNNMDESSATVDKTIQVSPLGRDGLPTKAVRFDIDFNDMGAPRRFPRRLKKLEGMPQLTAEQLKMKQEMAEEKRAKELQRKTETLSKRHRDLFEARENERLKNAQIQMEQKFLTNERNRQNHMKGVISKQQEREKKAKKVREKSCLQLEGSIIEVDETYDSDGDSQDEDWSGEQQDESRFAQHLDDSTDEFYESAGTQIR